MQHKAEYSAHEITMNRWRNPKKMIRVHCPSDGSGFKTRAMSILEQFNPYYSHRLGWVVSPRKFAKFEAAMAQAAPLSGRVMGEWKVGNNGTGKRIWFVYRGKPNGMQVHSASNGRYIRYAGISGALRIANRLNSEAMTPIAVDARPAPVAD